ncbi:hypothetical protein [Rhodovulum visakhapatnamense]|nr:hypothetical protein [Rhodovulum visakhapatnamense]
MVNDYPRDVKGRETLGKNPLAAEADGAKFGIALPILQAIATIRA